MNEIISTIKSRYSCRSFRDMPLPEETLRLIAEAGAQAPSAMNLQPWRIVVVSDRSLIDELEQEGLYRLSMMADKTGYERIMSRGGKLFYGAPHLVVIPIEQINVAGASLDCGIVTENIALAAASLGVGSCICGLMGLALSGDKGLSFKKRLGFPEGYEFGTSVLLGHPTGTGTPHIPDYDKISYL